MEILLINTRLCLEIQRVVNGQVYFIPKIERYIKRHELATDNLNRNGVTSTKGDLKEANQINNMFHFLESLYVKFNSKNDVLKVDGNKWERINSLVFFPNNENFTDVIQNVFNDFKKHFENKMLDNSVEVFAKRQLSPVNELLKQFDIMIKKHEKALMTIHHCLPYDSDKPNTSNSFSYYLYTIELVVKQTKDLIYRHYPELEVITEHPHQKEASDKNEFSILEYATIFFYAFDSKLLPKTKTIKDSIKSFIEKHEIETTQSSFRNNFYEAKQRINNKSDYPIYKLESLLLFIEANYPKAIDKVKNDINYLQDELQDNQ